jgi:hypothetical protein
MAESYKTLLPDAFNSKGGGQGAYGIAQWRGSRLEDLVNFNKNYPNTAPPLNANKNLGPIVRGTTSEETSGENRMASLMDMLMGRRPEEENRSEMTGMNKFFNQRNQATGLTPFQSLGAGMDSLILRGYGQGEAIREQGLRQAAQDKTNLTAEFFRGQPNGALYAEMLEMGVPIGQVYTAYQKAQAGDYVVVGDALVDRKTGKVIYQGKTGGQSQGTIELPDGTKIALGKQSEAQAKGMDFGARMELANMTINQVEDIGADLGQTFFSKIPVFGNAMVSTEFQQYNQAREQFINSVLRRESGAAIAASEFEGANKQYFPQPFDGPEVIAQKRAARQIAIDMILASSGPNASELAKQKANELAKSINPLFGTEEYKKERELLKSGGNKNKTAGGNNIVDPSTFK